MRAAPADFEAVCRFLHARSGVVLGDDKSYLIRSLLAPLVRREARGSLAALVERLEAEPEGDLAAEVVETLLNNETWFFRDLAVFSALRGEVLPALAERPRRPLRFWSAACSSGQEAYSIAMAIHTWFPQLGGEVEIWATDWSESMVQRTRKGVYTQLEVNRGLPAPMLVRHFEEAGGDWRVRDDLRGDLRVQRLDLTGAWGHLPEMDVIFLRNVLIYFDDPTRREVLARVRARLRPDGFLFLGSAEATFPPEADYAVTRCGKAAYHRARALEVRR